MCGLAGELRFDGRPADVAALRADDRRAWSTAGPTARGVVGPRARSRWATAGCRSSTCSATGAQPMVDSALGLTVVFNGCIYNYQQLRAELEGAGYRFFSTSDTEVDRSRPTPTGARTASTTSSACSPSRSSSTAPAGWCSAATGWASSRCTSTRPPTGCGSPPPCRRCWPAAASTPRSTGSRWPTT